MTLARPIPLREQEGLGARLAAPFVSRWPRAPGRVKSWGWGGVGGLRDKGLNPHTLLSSRS